MQANSQVSVSTILLMAYGKAEPVARIQMSDIPKTRKTQSLGKPHGRSCLCEIPCGLTGGHSGVTHASLLASGGKGLCLQFSLGATPLPNNDADTSQDEHVLPCLDMGRHHLQL